MSATATATKTTRQLYAAQACRAGDLLEELDGLLHGWPDADGEGSLKLPTDCRHADTVDVATITKIATMLEAVAAELRN